MKPIRHLLVAPAAAHLAVQPATDVYTMSAGRGGAYVALVVGLIAVALGGLALVRARRSALLGQIGQESRSAGR